MNNKLALIGAASALALAMGGCSDDDKTSLTSLVPKKISIEGTAARGAPIVGGEVRAQGANGALSTIDITDDDGKYSITAIGLTPPIIVRIKNGHYDDPTSLSPLPTEEAGTQVAMLTTVVNNTTVTMNLTPLTTLAVQQAAGQANLDLLFGSWETTQPTTEELATAAAVIRANLANTPAAQAIADWETYDFFSTPFTADSVDLVDVLLDDVICAGTASTAVGAPPVAVICTPASGVTWNPDIPTEGFVIGGEPGGSGSGTPVTGGGTGTLTASASTPASGNGTLTLTGAEVSLETAAGLTRIQAEGDEFIVKIYYTTATGAVTNVSYFWGNVNFDDGTADNVVFCTGACGATVDTVANTVTLTGSALEDIDGTTLATLNGTISGLALADLSVGGCTSNCQMTATYTSSFTIPSIPAFPTTPTENTETVSGVLSGITVAAITTSIQNENDGETNIVVTQTLNTATRKTFSATFSAQVVLGALGAVTANYTQTYDYVQL